MFYSIRNIDSTCTGPLDLIGDIYLYIIKLGCFLNICTYVTYTNQIIREKISTLLLGTPFFIQVFHHTPFILAHTLLPVQLCVRCSKKGNSLCAIN